MRTFYFKARNVGQEKYLTYTMGEETELDEDVLDYCEENDIKELVDIIYEEDDDYDYLTYDISGRTSLNDLISDEVSAEQALLIVRNVANNLISLKEQTIHLSYILLNRDYVYVNESNEITFICLPVESKGSLSAEFKGFLRQLLANMKYNVDEDLSFVGKLLTYINGTSFNLRGLVGHAEALMDEAGIEFDEAGAIESDGVEVVSSEPVAETESETEEEPKTSGMSDFMNAEDDVPLPELSDDEDEEEPESELEAEDADEELDSILPAGMNEAAEADVEDAAEAEPELESEEIEPETVPEAEATEEAEPESESEAEAEPEQADAAAEDAIPEIPEIAVPEATESVPESEPEAEKAEPEAKPAEKDEDLDAIKNKIKALVGEEAGTEAGPKIYKSKEEMMEALKNRPKPEQAKADQPKKNVVKVNRAAIIQSLAEHEAEEAAAAAQLEKEAEESAEAVAEQEKEKEKEKEKEAAPAKTEEVSKPNSLLNAPKAMPYLIRVNTEERIMLNKPVFKLGKGSRGVDYTIGGNNAISRQHAIISQKDGVCYIKDNKSTNHTYVNDRIVDEGAEEILTHDSTIRLGDEEFLFKIR